MRFLGDYLRHLIGINQQVVSDTTTLYGKILDRLSFREATILAITGETSGVINSCIFKLQHGDSPDGSDMTDVEGAIATLTTNNSLKEIQVDLNPLKRYIRVIVSTDLETSSYISLGAIVVLGNADYRPVWSLPPSVVSEGPPSGGGGAS